MGAGYDSVKTRSRDSFGVCANAAWVYVQVMTDKDKFTDATKDGHVWRSQLLDHFAGIEKWVVDRSAKIGIKTSSASLGQRVKSLVTHKTHFKYPKRIDDLAERINAALALRNEMVHSKIKTVLDGDGQASWLFCNVARNDPSHPLCLDAEQFRQIQIDLKKLKKELEDQPLKATTPTATAATSAKASK